MPRARLSSSRLRPRHQQQQAPQHPQSGPWGAPPQQYGHGYGHKPYKRRKSFLEDLFD